MSLGENTFQEGAGGEEEGRDRPPAVPQGTQSGLLWELPQQVPLLEEHQLHLRRGCCSQSVHDPLYKAVSTCDPLCWALGFGAQPLPASRSLRLVGKTGLSK